MTVLSKAEGVSVIEETIFEARFHTALQLQRMEPIFRLIIVMHKFGVLFHCMEPMSPQWI